MADANLTFTQVVIASLASGAIGGVIGAGSSLLTVRMASKDQREAAREERRASADDRKEQRRVADLLLFQDAVDAWARAWSTRLASWQDHSLEDPPANDSFIELLFAQGAVRTAAARVGDRNLVDELQGFRTLRRKSRDWMRRTLASERKRARSLLISSLVPRR